MPVDTFVQNWQGYALILGIAPISYNANKWIWILGTVVLGIGLILLIFAGRRSRRAGLTLTCTLILATAGCSTGSSQGSASGTPVSKTSEVGSGPRSDLFAEPASIDLGTIVIVPSDQTRVVSAKLWNQYDRNVNIIKITPGCSCTDIKLQSTSIKPYSFVEFDATIHLGFSEAKRRNIVVFETDDAKTSTIEVAYIWNTINTLHVLQKEITVRRDGKSSNLPRFIDIQSRGFSPCHDCVVETKSQDPLIAKYEPNESIEFSPTHRPSNNTSGSSSFMGRVRLSISNQAFPCEAQYPVEVVVHCKGIQRATIQFPVNVRVFPELKIHPDRLSPGVMSPGQTVLSEFTISKPDGSLFAIKEILCPGFNDNIVPEFQNKKSDLHRVVLKIQAPDRKGVWRAPLTVTLDTGEIISISVSALIRD